MNPGHLDNDKEAGEAASGRVLLHEPAEQGDLGLRRLRLHRRQRRTLPRLKVSFSSF